MKNILVCFSLFIFTFSFNYTVFGNRIIFASKNNKVWFQVEKSKNDLIVESNKFKRKQLFYLVKNNVFENKLGATIQVLNDEEILYDDPNHRLKFKLYREEIAPKEDPRAMTRSNGLEMNTTQLEGTWFSNSVNKKLAIVSTRNGFKIKFSGATQWTDFEYNKDSDYFFDAKGNKYSFKSLNEAEWIAADDSRKIIITRVSNSIEY